MSDSGKPYAARAREMALEAKELAKSTGKLSIFSIENTAAAKAHFPPIRHSPGAVSGVAKITSVGEAREIAAAVDGIVGIVLLDVERKAGRLEGLEAEVSKALSKSRLMTAKPNDMTVDAADALISCLMDVSGRKAAVIGAGNLGGKLALKLVERGASVSVTRRDGVKAAKIADAINLMKNKFAVASATGAASNLDAAKDADILICFAQGAVTAEMAAAMSQKGLLIDGGIGTLQPDAAALAARRGIRVLRLDMRAGFSGGITTILETEGLVKNAMGRGAIAGVPIVAGGFIGARGDVVVDSVSSPSRVIGIADGRGGIAADAAPEEMEKAALVQKAIEGSRR